MVQGEGIDLLKPEDDITVVHERVNECIDLLNSLTAPFVVTGIGSMGEFPSEANRRDGTDRRKQKFGI